MPPFWGVLQGLDSAPLPARPALSSPHSPAGAGRAPLPGRVSASPLRERLAWESLGRLPPHPTGFPLPGLPGFPCFLRGRLRGFTPGFAARSPFSRLLGPALSRRLRELGGGGPHAPAATPARGWAPPKAEARAAGCAWIFQRRAVETRGGREASPRRLGLPGCYESPRSPSPGPRNALFGLEWGAGSAASEALGRAGGGGDPRTLVPPAAVSFPRLFRSLWCLCPCASESFGLGLRLSVRPPPPSVHPPSGGRPGAAAAGRRRGSGGGGGGQEAGLVVIFGYLAV